MSTNSNCDFIEVKKGEWFYVLEHRNAPKNAWDWHEHATAYGPFSTESEAERHLAENHPNPGGSCSSSLPEGQNEARLSQTLARLIEEARAAAKTNSSSMRPSMFMPVRRRW